MRLPDDAEVADEFWDEVIECLMIRVQDKVAIIRTCAVRALSRFATDCESSDVLDLLLEVLPVEPSAVSTPATCLNNSHFLISKIRCTYIFK